MNKKVAIFFIAILALIVIGVTSEYYLLPHHAPATPTQQLTVPKPPLGLCASSDNYNSLATAQNATTTVCGLNLPGQHLASTSVDFTKFTYLETLNVSFNGLMSVPEDLGSLKNLVSLNLSNNQISQLPDELSQLLNLSNLDVSHNNLSDLPANLAILARMKQLNIGYNNFTALPAVIVQLKGLVNLYIGNNPITSLSESTLKALPHLTLVAIQNTKIPAATIATLEKDFPQITFITK